MSEGEENLKHLSIQSQWNMKLLLCCYTHLLLTFQHFLGYRGLILPLRSIVKDAQDANDFTEVVLKLSLFVYLLFTDG